MSKHENNGNCQKCLEIINLYPGFNEQLRDWFVDFQKSAQEFHVSCAGRGRVAQEECFDRGASKAHWGESAHNYNCALDLFALVNNTASWPKPLFEKKLRPALQGWMNWYGMPDALFYELPHVETKDWRDQLKAGFLKLVG